jgi:predicted DNA binding CopG/RHH family protein
MKKELKIPKFKNYDEELDFWSKLDLSEYFEPEDFEPVIFPNLKPSTRSISIRIPEMLIYRVKEKANEMNIPYQSLIKKYIRDGVVMDRAFDRKYEKSPKK